MVRILQQENLGQSVSLCVATTAAPNQMRWWWKMAVGKLKKKGNHMSTTSERLGKQAKEVTDDLQEMGGTVRDAAQKKLGQVGDKASEYYEQGQEKVHGVACACEQFVRQRPLRSVLIAAGIGWLLGRFWKHR
jgi:ElaB/YqjD/DUF883 family membrane-anchored ribosome-binding protein